MFDLMKYTRHRHNRNVKITLMRTQIQLTVYWRRHDKMILMSVMGICTLLSLVTVVRLGLFFEHDYQIVITCQKYYGFSHFVSVSILDSKNQASLSLFSFRIAIPC